MITLKDKGTLIDDLMVALKKEKIVKIDRLGIFELKIIKGRKVFSSLKRKMIATPPFKQISFRATKGVKDFINNKK